MLGLEAIALSSTRQRFGIGSLLLQDALDEFQPQAIAAVTDHPAITKIINREFRMVVPDLGRPDMPCHHANDRVMRHVAKVYASKKGLPCRGVFDQGPKGIPMVVGLGRKAQE